MEQIDNYLTGMTMTEFIIVYGIAVTAFILGVAVGMLARKGRPYQPGATLTLEEMERAFKRASGIPETLDDLVEDAGREEEKKPIIDVKLGAVRRPTAEELYEKEHPAEAAERNAMREGIERSIEQEKR